MEAHSGEKSNHPNGALAMCTDRSFKTKNLDGCIPALVCSPFASSSKLDVLTERTPSILVVVRTACYRIAVLSAKGAECSRGEVTRILGYDKMSAYHGWVNVHLPEKNYQSRHTQVIPQSLGNSMRPGRRRRKDYSGGLGVAMDRSCQLQQ